MVDKNSHMSQKHGIEWLRRINTNKTPTLKIRNKCEISGRFEFSNGDGYFNISTRLCKE